MSRIKNTFKSLDRSALISFIMAGDPNHEESLAAFKALPEAGADIIELGMPFTDPAADGPTIQKAGERALAAGATMQRTLDMVRNFRTENDTTPIILMGYANPLFVYGGANGGFDAFCKDAAEAGVDGLIIVDLPPEESQPLIKATKARGLDFIRLITPTTDEARLEKLLEGASGFLYYVSIAGITGAAKAQASDLEPHIAMIKSKTDLPIAIGFGIKTPADAAEMAKIGEGVVVGSALVQTLLDEGQESLVKTVAALAGSL